MLDFNWIFPKKTQHRKQRGRTAPNRYIKILKTDSLRSMEIDKDFLNDFYWYEDIDGNRIHQDDNTWEFPKDAVTYHSMWPLEVRETIYNIDHENHKFDGQYSLNVNLGSGSEDVIMAMVNSGDYRLSEAIILYSQSCERCANVLANKYLGKHEGYTEYSKEWLECGTVCRFCKNANNYIPTNEPDNDDEESYLTARITDIYSGSEEDRSYSAWLLNANGDISYRVERIEMGASHTSVYLDGVGSPMNSVNLTFYKDDEEFDIFNSPKYNRYLNTTEN